MPLFSTVDDARNQVQSDLVRGFENVFEGGDLVVVGPFDEHVVGSVPEDLSASISVLAWEWPVRHIGALQGIAGTNRMLTMRGVTVIDGSGGGDLTFARYIDWLGLYAELGAVTIARPQVDDRKSLPVSDNVPFPEDPVDPLDPDVI